jgi:hypothetical protein
MNAEAKYGIEYCGPAIAKNNPMIGARRILNIEPKGGKILHGKLRARNIHPQI